MRTLVFLALLPLAACTGTPAETPEPAQAPDATPEAAGTVAQATQADAITLEGAWVRAVPPSAGNSALFGTLNNSSSAQVEITGATSKAAGTVELHTHIMEDGTAKMRQVEKVAIAGQDHVHLKPGGDHVMLIGLTNPLTEGGEVAVDLTFADGSSKTVTARVMKEGPEGHAHGGGHAHEGGHAHDEGHAHGDGHDHDHDAKHPAGEGHEHTHGDGTTHDHAHDHDKAHEHEGTGG